MKIVETNEKILNHVMFIYIFGISILGWGAVMLFLNGGLREYTFLLSGVCAIITKLFEKKLKHLAKYVYMCIPPIIGAITCAVCSTNDSGSYICITHYYFVATLLLLPHYNLKLIKLSCLVTIFSNAIMMLAFPAGFLKLHALIGWIYTGIFYLVLFAACIFINNYTHFLFGIIKTKAEENKSYENQLEVIAESEFKVHALRHDMKRHLQGIYSIAKQEENKDILRYLEQMHDSLINPKEYIKTGNPKMDAIINYIFARAEQLNINVKQNIKVSKHIAIEAYELNIILGNLLENALEAAEESIDKYIYLQIVENKGILVISVKNSYNGNLVTYGDKILSTKNGSKHGYGLANVKSITEMHNGTMDIHYTDTEFHVKIILYL